jgi:hypothetical protein
MRLRRPRDDFVDPKVGGDAIHLVQELLAGFVVIDLVGAVDDLIAVEPFERLEIRRDRRDNRRTLLPRPGCGISGHDN